MWQWWRHLGLTLAREAWRVGARDGAWRILVARGGAWKLQWWSGFHEKVDWRRRILVVPAKTQSVQGSRRRCSGNSLETMNDGGCRYGTRDDDWNASEVYWRMAAAAIVKAEAIVSLMKTGLPRKSQSDGSDTMLEILEDCIVFFHERIYISALYRRHKCAVQVKCSTNTSMLYK